MGRYRNFVLAIYCTAPQLMGESDEALSRDLDFYQKYAPLDKAYLELHRGDTDVPVERLRQIKALFESRGIRTAGGYTATSILKTEGAEKKQRLMNALCYSDHAMLEQMAQNIADTAAVFDEIILDDFFFTNCTCDDCRREKGDKSWAETRMRLMDDASQKYVIAAAKRVNPNCRVIIKFPNWAESYHECGYDPLVESEMYDGIYTGTETRQPGVTHQHLPRYLSYSLPRLLENLAPGRNGGGWFDWLDCGYSLNGYLEQMYLTALSGCKEMTLFCMSGLTNNIVVPPLGFMLDRLDAMLDVGGEPIGLPAYQPLRQDGEDHLSDDFGMCGFTMEPVPNFPENAPCAFFPQSAVGDPDVVEKLKAFCAKGGRAIITSGFLREAIRCGMDIAALTAARVTTRTMTPEQYSYHNFCCGFAETVPAGQPVAFPVIEIRNNTDWVEMAAVNGSHNNPILVHNYYGQGDIWTVCVPEDYNNLRLLPPEALTQLRKLFASELPVYLDGHIGTLLFPRDNGSFVLLRSENYPRGQVTLRVSGEAKALRQLFPTGWSNQARTIAPLYTKHGETVFETWIEAGEMIQYQIER